VNVYAGGGDGGDNNLAMGGEVTITLDHVHVWSLMA
jgi:hypothetical protein